MSRDLHLDVGSIIASFADDTNDIRSLRLVSKDWKELASTAVTRLAPRAPLESKLAVRFPMVDSIDLSRQLDYQERSLEGLPGFRKLSTLSCEKLALKDSALQSIASCRGITSLNLRGCKRLTWAGLGQLCEMPNLRTLNCAGVKWTSDYSQSLTLPCLLKKLNSLIVGDTCTLSFVDDSLMALIATHSCHLSKLDCSGCIDITDAGAASLSKMPQLQWLSLQSCVRITNATAFNIGAALPGLTSLNLRGCLQINDEGLGALSTLTRLTSLSVQGLVGLKGTGFKALSGLTALEVLNTQNCPSLTSVEHIAALKGLHTLRIGQCDKLSVSQLGCLGGLPNLTALDMSGLRNMAPLGPDVEAANAALEQGLARLNKLQSLDCTGFRHPQGLPPGLLRAIGQMTSLTQLRMGGCCAPPWPATATPGPAAQDLSFLSSLARLQHLNMAGWRHTDPAQLAHLAGLTALHSLNIGRLGNEFVAPSSSTEATTSSVAAGASGAAGAGPAEAGEGAGSQQGLRHRHQAASSSRRAEECRQSSSSVGLGAMQVAGGIGGVGAMADGSSASLSCESGEEDCTMSSVDCPVAAAAGGQAGTLAAHPIDVLDTFSQGSCCTTSQGLRASQESSQLGSLNRHLAGIGLDMGGADSMDSLASRRLGATAGTSQQATSFAGIAASLSEGCSAALSLSKQAPASSSGGAAASGSLLDAALVHLGQLRGLRELFLDGCSQLSDEGVSHLVHLTSLTHLNLGGCRKVAGLSLARVAAACSQLRSLCLEDCMAVQEEGLVAAAPHLKRLSKLDMGGCSKVGDAACTAIGGARLGHLTELSLRGCTKLSSTGVGALASGLPSLSALSITHCWGVDEAAVAAIATSSVLARLSVLDVSHCWKIGDACLDALEQARPTLLVKTERDFTPPPPGPPAVPDEPAEAPPAAAAVVVVAGAPVPAAPAAVVAAGPQPVPVHV